MEERRVERHGDKNLQKTSKKDILETKESYWEKDKTKCKDKERKKERKKGRTSKRHQTLRRRILTRERQRDTQDQFHLHFMYIF